MEALAGEKARAAIVAREYGMELIEYSLNLDEQEAFLDDDCDWSAMSLAICERHGFGPVPAARPGSKLFAFSFDGWPCAVEHVVALSIEADLGYIAIYGAKERGVWLSLRMKDDSFLVEGQIGRMLVLLTAWTLNDGRELYREAIKALNVRLPYVEGSP
jgi:hypothetical protein